MMKRYLSLGLLMALMKWAICLRNSTKVYIATLILLKKFWL
jgi:hypothetical protein